MLEPKINDMKYDDLKYDDLKYDDLKHDDLKHDDLKDDDLKHDDLKHDDFISWDEYFMAIAKISALKSKDPVTKVGACVVSENNRVMALGYNGMPCGCDDEKMPWGKNSKNNLENKYLYVCHAELNAILSCVGQLLKNAKIYVTLFPCCECAKAIIQVGIKQVIYENIKNEHSNDVVAAKKMFNMAKINLKKHCNKGLKIEFDL